MNQFIELVEKARTELLKAHKMAYDNSEWQRAGFVTNAINQLDALLHMERITRVKK